MVSESFLRDIPSLRVHRIYHAGALQPGITIELSAKAHSHLFKVLKVKAKHELELFNGDGNAYGARVLEASKSSIVAHVDSVMDTQTESPLKIHLGQVISRGDKMDLTIQKAVELGVTCVTPLFSERCGVQLSKERLEKKMAHWQQIIYSACEQSRRNVIPELNSPQKLQQWLEISRNSPTLMMHLNAQKALPLERIKAEKTVNLLVGPEGGFSELEVEVAEQAGVQKIVLGPRVLRTETAALSMISILQYLVGDFTSHRIP